MYATIVKFLTYAAQGALGWVVGDLFSSKVAATTGESRKKWILPLVAGLTSLIIGLILIKRVKR